MARKHCRDIVSSLASGTIAAEATRFHLAGVTQSALRGQCYEGHRDVFLMRFDTRANPLWIPGVGTAGPDRQASIAIGASSVDVSGFSAGQTTFLTTIDISPARLPNRRFTTSVF